MADLSQYEPIPIHGEPGVGIVGTNRYQVGVQSDSPDIAAWSARQPNLDRAKATEEANRVAKEGLYLDHLMLNQRTTTSARAVEAALTFQAMRNYERDLSTAKAAGLSEEQAALQALVRNPKVLGSGAGFGSAVRALTPTPPAFTPTPVDVPGAGQFIRQGRYGERMVPVPSQEGYTPNVVNVEGAGPVLRTGKNTSQLLRKDEVNQTQRLNALKAQASIYQEQLRDLPRDKKPPVQEKLDKIMEQIGEYNPKSIAAPAQATPSVRIRSKVDGKIRPYYGPASDVPLDRYEILP